MALKDRLYEAPVIGTALRVQDRYQQDAGDQFAGAIGFFGFLSLFPILLLALAVVGFVLADASDQQLRDIATQISRTIPGFAGALGDGDTGIAGALEGIIENAGAVAGIGAITALLAGLRVVNAAQTATLVIFRVDRSEMVGVKQKAKQVAALVGLGLLALAGAAAGSAIGLVANIELFGAMDVLAPVLTTAGTFLLDSALFLAAYRVFGTRKGPQLSTLLPGAVLAGAGWTALKLFGATYVSSQVARAGELYGAVGGVIGLLLLFYLAGRLYVYGAELSAVRAPNPGDPTESVAEGGPESRADERDPAAAAAAAGAPPVESGEPLFGAHSPHDTFRDTPHQRPPRSGTTTEPALLAPAASDATRERLAAMPEPPRGGQGRQALGFALAVGAVAGLVGVLRPWEDD